MNGLFNEIMSSAMNRSLEFQSMDESVSFVLKLIDFQVLESMAAHKIQKLNELFQNKANISPSTVIFSE